MWVLWTAKRLIYLSFGWKNEFFEKLYLKFEDKKLTSKKNTDEWCIRRIFC